MSHGERLHGANLALNALGTVAVRLVDHKHVSDLHDAGLDGLHVVAHPRHKHNHGHVGESHDIDFVLSDADRLDDHQVPSARVDHGRHVGRCAGQSAERSACRHAANVNARVRIMRLHADAVAQNCASAERAGGIDSNDADGLLLLTIFARDLIHQCALARPRRTGKAKQHGISAEWKKGL